MSADHTDLPPGADDIARGGATLVGDAPLRGAARRSGRRLSLIAVVTVAAVVGAVFGARAMTDSDPAPAATTTGPSGSQGADAAGTSATSRVMSYDLPRLVSESPRIVVATVSDVQHADASDAGGGLDYLLATLRVDETIRGPKTAEVVAFDYEYGGTSISAGAPIGATFEKGERVLVFLADVTGTVHEGIQPSHWQVTGGGQGEFAMKGEEPDASFTLADVRQAAEAQPPT